MVDKYYEHGTLSNSNCLQNVIKVCRLDKEDV